MKDTWSRVAFAALLLTTLSVRSLKLSQAHLFPAFDEVAYLDLARGYEALGGPAAVVECHLRGLCKEDNRHPLYSMMLAPALDRPPNDFAVAKLMSLAIAFFFCAAVFFMSRAAWNEPVAWLCLTAAALAPSTAQLSQTLCADLAFAGFYFASAAALAARSRDWRNWLAAGVLAGLAYLTKGNGHALLLAPLTVGLWLYRRDLYKKPGPYCAIAGFALVASFLLVRNIRVWGDPFHNVNMAYMWMDSWRQSWFVSSQTASGPLLAIDYWNHHSWADMALRMLRGGAEVARALVLASAPGPDAPAWRYAAGAATVFLAVRAVRRRWISGRREDVLAFLAPGLFLFTAFSWAAKALGANERFVLPLAASLWPFAAEEAMRYWERRPRSWNVDAARARACLALPCAAYIAFSAGAMRTDPLGLWAVPAYWAETSRWLGRNVGSAGFLISSQSPYSAWDCCRDLRRPYPFDVPPSSLLRHMEEAGIEHILLDQFAPATHALMSSARKPDRHGPTELLDWPRCFHDSLQPSAFLVFSKDCRAEDGGGPD